MSPLRFPPLLLSCAALAAAFAGCSGPKAGRSVMPDLSGAAAAPAGVALPDKRGKITFFFDDYADPVPAGITAGPDGALWFTDTGNDTIGRMTTRGAYTFFHTGEELSNGIAVGSDGALWFTTSQYHPDAFIGRITTAGALTLFNNPDGDYPQGITAGPDGALWFGESNGTIGRITTGGSVTHFKVGPARATIGSLVTGPDGALWATQSGNYVIGKIVRLETSGKVKTYKPAGTPQYICAGPDGALWFTEFNNAIGRITTSGSLHEFPIKRTSSDAFPVGIAAGSDGALWFTYDSLGGAAIGRITTAGKQNFYSFATSGSASLAQIAPGPLRSMWFTSAASPSGVGRITVH